MQQSHAAFPYVLYPLVQVALPGDIADLLGNARHRASVCSALLRCFAFDRAAGPLLLFAGVADSGGSYGGASSARMPPAVPASAIKPGVAEGSTQPLPSTAPVPSVADPSTAAAGTDGHKPVPSSMPATGAVTGSGSTSLAANGATAVLLLRMPAGLLYVASPRA